MKARNLPATPATVALWTFEDTTVDIVGGADIKGSTGTGAKYAELIPGVRGLFMINTYYTPILPSLQITGDLTVEFLMRTRDSVITGQTNPSVYLACAPAGTGETEARNWLYCLRRQNLGGFEYFHESGLGVDSSHEWRVADLAGKTQHIALTRAAGDVTLYIDGISWGTATVGSPTGGTECVLCLGDRPNASAPGYAVYGSLRIENVARNADQIRNDYNWTLGRYYGKL